MCQTHPHRLKYLNYVLIVVSGTLYLGLVLRILWRNGDEGLILYGAQAVLDGKVPYRDFFEVFGPGSFYWNALFFTFFGTNFYTARALLLVTGVCLSLLTYWMTRRLYQGPFALLPAVFFLLIAIPTWPAVSHHWDSNLFFFLTFSLFLLSQETDSTIFMALAGIFSGLTFVFLQQKGIILVCSIPLALLIIRALEHNTQKLFLKFYAFFSCFLIVAISTIVLFYLHGGLGDFLHDTIIWPLHNYEGINHVPYGFGISTFLWRYFSLSLSLLPSGQADFLSSLLIFPYVLIVVLPFIVAGLFAFCATDASYRSKVLNASTVPYVVFGTGLWLSESHRPDMFHLVYGSGIAVILLFFLANLLLQKRRLLRTIVLAIMLVSLLTSGIFNLAKASSAVSKTASRRGVLFSNYTDEALNFLDNTLNEGDYVFIYPCYPMYYFLANLRNPTRYNSLFYGYNTKKQFKEAIKSLEQKKPEYILLDSIVEGRRLVRWFPYYKHPNGKDLVMEQYIMNKYKLIGTKNGFRIMKRKRR